MGWMLERLWRKNAQVGGQSEAPRLLISQETGSGPMGEQGLRLDL